MPNLSDPQKIKKNQILDTAYKCFSQYGYSKTTMNEIARDLSISKALLYYYFPDKSQLYAGVIRKLSNEYLTLLKQKVKQAESIDDVFFFIVDKMHETLSSHYNFFDYIKQNQENLPEIIWGIIQEINKTEVDLLTGLYLKQADPTFEETHNLQEIIQLIFKALDSVKGSFNKQKPTFFPNQEQLENIYSQKKLLLQILLNGLKTL